MTQRMLGFITPQFLNRSRLARDFLGRRTACSGLPIELSIELTSRCNLKCVMCPRDDDAPRGLGNMRMGTFRRIIDEASEYLEFTFLHLAGEPLLHPQFPEFIDYAESKGVTTGLSTNATILDSERRKSLIASNLAYLVISIDATDSKTYEKVRGAKSFDKVVQNTEAFLAEKKRAGRGPHTIVQMICMKENRHQGKAFSRRWKRLGADAVRLKRFFNFAGNVEDRSGGATGNVSANNQNGERPPCFLPWRQLAFYYDGTAVACCHDFLHQSELGNIHQHGLRDIWNSESMVALREKHVAGRQQDISLCAGCNQPRMSTSKVLASTVFSAERTKRLLISVERFAQTMGLNPPY